MSVKRDSIDKINEGVNILVNSLAISGTVTGNVPLTLVSGGISILYSCLKSLGIVTTTNEDLNEQQLKVLSCSVDNVITKYTIGNKKDIFKYINTLIKKELENETIKVDSSTEDILTTIKSNLHRLNKTESFYYTEKDIMDFIADFKISLYEELANNPNLAIVKLFVNKEYVDEIINQHSSDIAQLKDKDAQLNLTRKIDRLNKKHINDANNTTASNKIVNLINELLKDYQLEQDDKIHYLQLKQKYLFKLKDYDNSEATFKETISILEYIDYIDEIADAYYEYAVSYSKIHDYKKAIELVNTAIEFSPDKVSYLTQLTFWCRVIAKNNLYPSENQKYKPLCINTFKKWYKLASERTTSIDAVLRHFYIYLNENYVSSDMDDMTWICDNYGGTQFEEQIKSETPLHPDFVIDLGDEITIYLEKGFKIS